MEKNDFMNIILASKSGVRKKILDKNISVNATAVRVPVLIGHSEAVTIKTKKPIDIDSVLDDYRNNEFINFI